MTAVTAKVTCTQKIVSGEGDAASAALTFQPDYQDGRNKEWSPYTPHLHLNMTVKGSVSEHFEPGNPYTLTFTPESGD